MVNLLILNDWLKFESWKSGYKRDTEVRNHCYANKTRNLYLFINTVKYGIAISSTKWLMTNKVNWSNVFIDNMLNKKKQHLIETYTNETHMWTITKLESCLQNKDFQTLYLAYNSIFWQRIKSTHINHFKH